MVGIRGLSDFLNSPPIPRVGPFIGCVAPRRQRDPRGNVDERLSRRGRGALSRMRSLGKSAFSSYTRDVLVCANCGEENPGRFRLCGFCGTPLAKPLPPQEVRKTVTIVFSDLQGSTSLGEKLDSESLREVLSRYFEVMRSVVEDHGGTIEKYIGDAIMAVFGLPRVHEDDARRAVRAAIGMKQALGVLNEELDQRWGVRLVNRTGVNTGEVVAGDPTTGQRLVSGDAVNVAARLEQAAPPLETLIGESTYRLVRQAVDVERVEPLELKGKAERVPAYRLVAATNDEHTLRQAEAPMVGRAAEVALILNALADAQSAHSPRVVTLIGDPGLGKSRLVEELSPRAATTARVLKGRCLSYGRGITFWPLVEIVRQAADIQSTDQPETSRQKLESLLAGAPDVAARIASAIGLGDTTFPLQEIYWGTRKLLEALATERPLVIVIEDVHWAEAAFLDLIEYAAQHVAASLLIICSGRPDLFETRPGWAEQAGWLRLDLQPLTPDDSARLIEMILGGSDLPLPVRERVVRAAEGNPLFVEQLLSMLVDDGLIRCEADGWRVTRDLAELAVPSSIEALLAARLELLTAEERAMLEPASVIGLVFRQDALEELVPDALRAQVDSHLPQLVRKQLVHLEADDAGGRWYRFHHILIRDTAYRRLLKRSRATLHERFADWGERVNSGRDGSVEYEEIHGYHLEQAHRYLSELGPLDDHGRQVGARAAGHLGAAGRRAFERGDMGATSSLLRRAAGLLPERAPERVALLPDLSEALMESGEFVAAESLLDEAIDTATALGDDRLLADATLSRLLVRRPVAESLDAWREEVDRETKRLIRLLEGEQADAELAKAWRMAAFVHGTVCQFERTVAAEQRALVHARRAGRRRLEARLSAALVQALRIGPTPVPEAIGRCQDILADGLVDQQAQALTTLQLAYLHALGGNITTARHLYSEARQRLGELGGGLIARRTSLVIGRVELLANDLLAAEAALRLDYDALGQMGERYFRPLMGALLAQVLHARGRFDEALVLTGEVEKSAAADDLEAQALWHCVRAKLVARMGYVDEALWLTERAVEILEPTDAPIMKGDAFLDQARVFLLADQRDEAISALRRARALYLLKEATLPLSQVDAVLANLNAGVRHATTTPR
jgi:predicted ATPase/class 3 adenylate cyclase